MLIATISLTLAMLVLLWWSDPKRRRTARVLASAQPRLLRRFYMTAALVPGAALALQGNTAAFFLWFGSCATGGWLISQFRV